MADVTLKPVLDSAEQKLLRHSDKQNKTSEENAYKKQETSEKNPGKDNEVVENYEDQNYKRKSDSVQLYFATFVANLIAFVSGVGFSWTSPVFPKLKKPEESPFNEPITPLQISLITALLCIGEAIGPFVFGYLLDKIGRKKSLILVAVPMFVAVIILGFATDIRLYYLARLLFGLGIGGSFTALVIYTVEITEDHNRGKFVCIQGVCMALGFFYSFSVGPFLTVRYFTLSCLVPLSIFLVVFTIFVPESPFYLVKIDEIDSAKNVVKFLHRKTDEEVNTRIENIQKFVNANQGKKANIKDLFRSKSLRKALVIGEFLVIIQQLSGMNVIYSFLETIFSTAGGTISPHLSTSIVGIIQVLTVATTPIAVEKQGRKFLLLTSALGTSLSMILLGVYFFLKSIESTALPYLTWLPLLLLVTYTISFNLGIGRVCWVVIGEIFPSNVKSLSTALVSTTCFLVSAVIIFLYPMLSSQLESYQSFLIFGLFTLIGAVFIYKVVPETKGRSLAEIQDLLSR